MTCIRTVREVLRWPFLLTDNQLYGSPIVNPATGRGPTLTGSGFDEDPNAQSGITEKLYQRIAVKRPGLVGIGVAADSPVPMADITLSPKSLSKKWRISHGSPMVGLPEEDSGDHISLLVSTPMHPGPAFRFTARDYMFDGIKVRDPVTTLECWAAPLILELFYGAMPPTRSHIRPPYRARANIAIPTTATAGFIVIVEGRRRVLINFVQASLSVTASYAIHALVPFIDTGNTRSDAQEQHTLVAATPIATVVTQVAVDLSNKLVGLLLIEYDDTAAVPPTATIDVVAYDD